MTISNPRLVNDLKGIEVCGDYAGAATDQDRVQVLIDLLQQDATMTHRGHMDQMSPSARIQVLAELEAMQAAVS